MKNILSHSFLLVVLCLNVVSAGAHFKTTPQSPVHITEEGKLVYKAYPNGDRVPDFSYCGYRQSETQIPWVAAQVYVPSMSGDATATIQKALDYVAQEYAAGRGVVVKADGLAAGKGVIVAANQQEAEDAVRACFSGTFGEAGSVVVIEELLIGEEASILALTDGKDIVPLVSSQDHKRLLDGDKGPNTGGMGAYSPAPVVTESLMEVVTEQVLNNFLAGIRQEGLDYRGIIYAGIMVTAEGPKVLEFNVRFGDPETEAILPRLKSSLFDVLYKTANKELSKVDMVWSENPSVGVVMASGGYPGTLDKGHKITGIREAEASGCIVFHAGTSVAEDGSVVNSGGRVLVVTAEGATVEEAVKNAYAGVAKIHFDGVQFRKDIAYRAIGRK